MEINNKLNRERILRKIGELKSEGYVGSQQAYRFAKARINIEENPEIISNILTSRLEMLFPKLSYVPLTQRVFCLQDIINENSNWVFFENYLGSEDHFGLPYLHLKDLSEELRILKWGFFENKSVEEGVRESFPFFKEANKLGIDNDSDFGESVVTGLNREYQNVRDKIDYSTKLDCDEFMGELINKLNNVNWEKELSTESFRERIKKSISIKDHFELSSKLLYERIKNDKIDHRLEYRRMILCKWLEEVEVPNYEYALITIDTFIRIKNIGIDLERNNFIKYLILTEKNFINRYLRN